MAKFPSITIDVDMIKIDEALEKAKELQGILKNSDSLSGRIVRSVGQAKELSGGKYWVVSREDFINNEPTRGKATSAGELFDKMAKGMNFVLTDGYKYYSVLYFNNMFA